MKSVRIKYSKNESVKFVSHLDTLKTFIRAARRADLPLVYSQGFNPHPHMVFGLPSSVGMISVSEYVDIDFEDSVTVEEIIKGFNDSLPEGFRIIECCQKDPKSNIMSEIIGAEFLVYFESPNSVMDLMDIVTHFMSRDEIIMTKETKSGLKDIDIHPLIFNIVVGNDDESKFLLSRIAAGNSANLKVAMLIDAINKYENADLKVTQITRTEVFLAKQA